MGDIQFNCPKCGHGLIVDAEGAGMSVPCPECHEQIAIPGEPPPAPMSERGNLPPSDRLFVEQNTLLNGKAMKGICMPDKVRKAVMLLYISLGLGVVRGILEATAIFYALIGAGVFCYVIHMISKGHNWARITYLVFIICAIPLCIRELVRNFAINPLSELLGIGQVTLHIFALVLIFQKPVSKWFYRPVRNEADGYMSPQKTGEPMTTEEQLKAMQKVMMDMRRYLRNVIWASAAVFLLAIFWLEKNRSAYTAGDEVKARRFWVVDAHGEARAMLGMNDDGSSGLSIMDKKGKLLAALGSDPNGVSVLSMFDANGQTRAFLGVGSDGSSALNMIDANDVNRAALSVEASGMPGLYMKDAQRQIRTVLGAKPSGEPVMRTLDSNGDLIWAAPN